jgi:hypothetical protein
MNPRNPIQRLLGSHSGEFLARKVGVTRASVHRWANNPEKISFKYLDKLFARRLITSVELETLEKNRDEYLMTLKK